MISILCVALALVYVFANRSGRLLWVTEGGRQMGGLILSPRGEVVSPRGSSIDLLDANGKSRPLISNSANLVPLASAGERGFVAVRHTPGASETILIDWEGRQQWTFPVASFQLKVYREA